MTVERAVQDVGAEQMSKLRRLAGELREACQGVRDEAARLSRDDRRRPRAHASALAAAARALERAAERGEALVDQLAALDCAPPSA